MSNITAERQFRSPYLQSFRSYSTPLTVLCTLLSRADGTPLNERRRDPNLLLDTKGELLKDPAAAPNAFENDANISFEKWTEYWRKVHGPRFIYAQPPEEGGIRQLLRYDQIHRLPAGPSSGSPLPYAAPVDAHGKLFDTVIGHIPEYRRPQWDGIAYLGFENADGIKAVFSQPDIAAKIMPEDQAIFRELCPVLAKQHIIVPSATQRDPILLVKIVKRNADLSRAQFHEAWLNRYAPLVLQQPATSRYVKRYVQLHNIGPVEAGEPFFHPVAHTIDGVSIQAFDSVNDLEDYLLDPGVARLIEEEAALVAADSVEYWSAVAYQVVNQIFPEISTTS
ncbi:EthD domain-containing protein [Trinickia diaoshuihuensis]|uniref:EthD domain-containing protein n=1 Tax=Trinickia diaoshuihuensis TaxID=2292265 RepID=UPI000E2496E9|nr:EthD domain-containing protein [Trinickia diaoshuihuensis]